MDVTADKRAHPAATRLSADWRPAHAGLTARLKLKPAEADRGVGHSFPTHGFVVNLGSGSLRQSRRSRVKTRLEDHPLEPIHRSASVHLCSINVGFGTAIGQEYAREVAGCAEMMTVPRRPP